MDTIDAAADRVAPWAASRWPGPLVFVVVAITYAGLSQYVMWLNDPVEAGAGFWPAAGVTTAALLLLPTRRWGWVIGAVVVAELLGNLTLGYPFLASLMWTAGNGAGPLVGATLVRRYVHPAGALVPLRNLLGFLSLGVIAGSLVGASIGSVGTIVFMETPAWQVGPKYVVGDALGALVVAPVLLTWQHALPRRHHLENLGVLIAFAIVPLVTFRNWDGTWDLALPHLLAPLLLWPALRYGVRGTTLGVLWVSLVADWATATGYGPFALAGTQTGHAITLLQVFLAIVAVSAFIVAVLVSDLHERTEAERRLEQETARLRRAIGRKETGLAVHDKVVQLLSTASIALRLDDQDAAIAATEAATAEAQLIVSDLLADMAAERGGVAPGDLVAGADATDGSIAPDGETTDGHEAPDGQVTP